MIQLEANLEPSWALGGLLGGLGDALGSLRDALGDPSWRTLEKPWKNCLDEPPRSGAPARSLRVINF